MELQEIIDYMNINRGRGHTHTQLNGIQKLDKVIIVTANRNQGPEIKALNSNAKVVTVDDSIDKLRGLNYPMVIDHYALAVLVDKFTSKHRAIVHGLEKCIDQLKKEISND